MLVVLVLYFGVAEVLLVEIGLWFGVSFVVIALQPLGGQAVWTLDLVLVLGLAGSSLLELRRQDDKNNCDEFVQDHGSTSRHHLK